MAFVAITTHAATPSLTPITVFRSSAGASFMSATQSLRLETTQQQIQFAFGYATDELVSPGVFSDSFTLSLGGVNPLLAILSTSDASGTVWAPSTPGTFPLSAGNLAVEEIAFPDLGTTFARQHAYAVTLTVPNEFTGQDLNFYSDFFNNQNGNHSLAWVGALSVVPEPSTWALLAVGLLLLFGFQWRGE